MSEYLQLKGKLAELKQKRLGLITAVHSHARSIKELVALANVQPVEELDGDAIHYHAGELKARKAEYAEVTADIARIRRELGEV